MPIIGKPLRNSDSIQVVRLDVALLERGLIGSRSKAQRLIADGKVSVNGVDITKVSTKVGCDDIITVDRGDDYVSHTSWSARSNGSPTQDCVRRRDCIAWILARPPEVSVTCCCVMMPRRSSHWMSAMDS